MSYPPNNNQGMQANYTGMQQGPGQGYVQTPNDIRVQNQGSYPAGMQGTGSSGPAGGGAPQGYGGGQGVGPQGVGPQGVVGSGQGYGQGVGVEQGYSQGGGGGFGSGTNAVAGPQYCLPQVSAYAVSKKVVSMSGGDWKITDATGRTVFKVSGRVASVRDKRFLRDPSNKTVLRMQKKVSECPFFPKFSMNCFLSSFAFFLLQTHRLLGSVCFWLFEFVGCVFSGNCRLSPCMIHGKSIQLLIQCLQRWRNLPWFSSRQPWMSSWVPAPAPRTQIMSCRVISLTEISQSSKELNKLPWYVLSQSYPKTKQFSLLLFLPENKFCMCVCLSLSLLPKANNLSLAISVSLPTSSSQHSCLLNLHSFAIHSCFSNYILLHLIFSHFYFNISVCDILYYSG